MGGGRPPAGRDPRYAAGPGGPAGQGGPGRPGVPGGDERTQAMGMPAGGFRGDARGDADGQRTEAIQTGGRRRRPPGRGGRGPGGPGGPGGPEGPGGRGPRDPRDFDEDDEKPRRRRTGWKRFLPSWKILVAAFTVLAAGTFGMIAVAYANTPTPTATQAEAVAQGSAIYYNDGKTLIAKVGTPRVILDNINKVPRHVQDAVIAIENNTFREDSGISIPGMIRSVWMTATGQQLQGASTITQQMARNYYDGLSQEVSFKRKIKEIFVAVKLDKEMPKDQILLQYLNTVPFGRAYGIEAAAQAYFKKHVEQLTPEQGAYLAARIQTPALDADAPRLQARFKDVVNAMAKLDPAKYGNLPSTAKFPKTVPERNSNELGGLKGYMVVQVMQELKTRMNLAPDQVRSGGYKIISTFDKKLMQAARKAVISTTSSLPKEIHAGLAAVDPKTGRVLAFYGGEDYVKDNWNEPFDSYKQAASAFKPYVLAAWLDAGYSLNSFVPGNKTVPEELPGTKPIGNSHNVGSAINVTTATADSVNTAFASMAYKLDEDNGTIGQLSAVKQIAEEAGLGKQRMEDDVKAHKYAFSIGSALVTPVEQAAGYSIFANEGKHVDYHVVKEVRKDKEVVFPERRDEKQVITPEAAADSVAAMEEVLKSGTARGRGIGRPAAGKTGTNNDNKEAWFVGFTPQISTAVGMYREQCVTKKGKIVQPINANCPETPGGKPSKKYGPNNRYSEPREISLGTGIEGATYPTTIWRNFMMEALAGKPVEQFPPKAGLGSPENIVPSPTPTPSPEPDDAGFPTDFPTDFPDDGGCYDGGPGCDNGGGDGRGFGDDQGHGGGQDGGPGGDDVPLNIPNGGPAALPTGSGNGKSGSGA
ncbi:transglycosylase domain-containing protein [Microbispora siamensis]|uniref:transglycosylase domain-containing protein n=1 Tax=Microbispora siamensis TaxID=564413 RepID=UPI00194FFC16|nr:transglycosylase domain-containing protein [Microbispora siamensis]